MKTNTGQPVLSVSLREAVEGLYTVFKSCTALPSLDVCTHCCMDAALEVEMRRLPLRQLTAQHFYAYNTSAKSDPQPVDELKYLLPRMLELLAAGAEIHHSTELFLDRLGKCEAGAFSAQEYIAIDAFAHAYFAQCLSQQQWQSGARRFEEDAFSLLLMFHIGGLDLRPLLEYWLKEEAVAATLHYVSSRFYDFPCDRNAFATDRPQFQEIMKMWLTDESHRRKFADRILELDMDAIDQTAMCYYGSRLTPKQMVETVFDLIA